MKIGIFLAFSYISQNGGIQVQARMWKEGLERLGHEAILCGDWVDCDYSTLDWAIIMGQGPRFRNFVELLSKFKNLKIAYAPILDWEKSLKGLKIRSYIGCEKLKFYKQLYDIRKLGKKVDLILVRSRFEREFVTKGFDIPLSKTEIVPLNCRIDPKLTSYLPEKKERFVLHVSRLAADGKNVKRLAEASKKYGFRLILGGSLNGDEEVKWMERLTKENPNIEYIGRLTDEQLMEYYTKARVFALPSIIEGVGMVALEAASFGCNIVLTDIGAPKEYFDGKAFLCNPFDVDDIGRKTLAAMNDTETQPSLRNHILSCYNEKACMERLVDVLKKHS